MVEQSPVLTCDQIAAVIGDQISDMKRVQPKQGPPPKTCSWQSEDKSRTITVDIQNYPISSAEIEKLKAGKSSFYSGDTPAYKVFSNERLDSIHSVAILPQNGPIALVHTGKYRANCVGVRREQALEISTRIAEHLVHNNL